MKKASFQLLVLALLLICSSASAQLDNRQSVPVPEYSIVGQTYVNYYHSFRIKMSNDYWNIYTGMLAPRMAEGAMVSFENKDLFMTGLIKLDSPEGEDRDYILSRFRQYCGENVRWNLMEDKEVQINKGNSSINGYRMSVNFNTEEGLAYVIALTTVYNNTRYYIQISGIYELYLEYYHHLDEILESFEIFQSNSNAQKFIQNNSYRSYTYGYTVAVPNNQWDIYTEVECESIGMDAILSVADTEIGIYGTLSLNRQIGVSLSEYATLTLEYLRSQSNGSFIVLQNNLLDETNTPLHKIAGVAFDTYFIYGLAARGSEKYQFVFYTNHYLEDEKLEEVDYILRSLQLADRLESEILALDEANRPVYRDNRNFLDEQHNISISLPISAWQFTDEYPQHMLDENAFAIFKNNYDKSFGYMTIEQMSMEMEEYVEMLSDFAQIAGGHYLALLDEGRISVDGFLGFFVTYSSRLYGLNYVFHIVIINKGATRYKLVFWVLEDNFSLVENDWNHIIQSVDFIRNRRR